ncbi:MAG TPA: hypothetical protein VMG32_05045 [Anaeromyxobacteraceae bacterium]|nr:hypothetical protein [Anaeromyxobacteraceae bacterium]
MSTARAIGIAARTAHLAAVALLVGGAFALPGGRQALPQALAVATGLVLLVTEAAHSRHWVYQGRGLATLAHVGVLFVIPLAPRLSPGVLLMALGIGSVGSHLPRTVRKWSLRHRRVLE